MKIYGLFQPFWGVMGTSIQRFKKYEQQYFIIYESITPPTVRVIWHLIDSHMALVLLFLVECWFFDFMIVVIAGVVVFCSFCICASGANNHQCYSFIIFTIWWVLLCTFCFYFVTWILSLHLFTPDTLVLFDASAQTDGK